MHINFNMFFMKRKEVIDFYNLISTLKVTKIGEHISNVILINMIKTSSYNDALNKAREYIQKNLFENITVERLSAFEKERKELNESNSEEFVKKYEDVITSNNKFIKALNTYLNQEVNIELEKTSYKDFIREFNKTEQELSAKDIITLSAMFIDYEEETSSFCEEDIDNILNDINND